MTRFEDQIVCFDKNTGPRFLQDFLAQRRIKNPLLVTGKASYAKSGAEQFVEGALGHSDAPRFSEFSPNPTLKDLDNGLSFFRNMKPDCVIAIGGGSVLDMAKLITFFGSLNLAPQNYLSSPGILFPSMPTIPLFAIPTTAGTGSEATHFAVLYEGKKKHSISDVRILPDAVILNPDLTKGIAPYNAACTGMDAFAQGIESFWATAATDESREYAGKAVRLSLEWLGKSVRNPNGDSRKYMQQAAYWAGRAINISKTTAPHAMSYALTAHYGLPHGHAVSLSLPEVLLANTETTDADCNDPRGSSYVRSTMKRLFSILGADGAESAARIVRSIISSIGLDGAWMAERNVDQNDARRLVVQEVNPERLKNNPRKLDEMLLKKIANNSILGTRC